MHTVERFTRVDAETLDYQITMEDPSKFTRPLTVVLSLTKEASVFFEYACHEGNYGMLNLLSAERNLEKAAAAKNRTK